MQARNRMTAVNEPAELAEEEDLNVSNLLVTKSERAPATEVTPGLKRPRWTEVTKGAAVGVLGSLAVAAGLILVRWLVFPPHDR
jgi:hypothetical protein